MKECSRRECLGREYSKRVLMERELKGSAQNECSWRSSEIMLRVLHERVLRERVLEIAHRKCCGKSTQRKCSGRADLLQRGELRTALGLTTPTGVGRVEAEESGNAQTGAAGTEKAFTKEETKAPEALERLDTASGLRWGHTGPWGPNLEAVVEGAERGRRGSGGSPPPSETVPPQREKGQ